MKKILFLLLVLQVNVVFGQLKLSENLRLDDYSIAEIEKKIFHKNDKKIVKKIEFINDDEDKVTAIYNKDGKLNELYSYHFQKAGRMTIEHRVNVVYDERGNIALETYQMDKDDKKYGSYFRFSDKISKIEMLFHLKYFESDAIDNIVIEKIDHQNNTKEYRYYNINAKKYKIGIKDTIKITKLLDESEALKQFDLGNLTFLGYDTYQYENNKVVRITSQINRNNELGDISKRELKYENDRVGYSFENGKVVARFYVSDLGNIEEVYTTEPYNMKEINKDRHTYDEYGNWRTFTMPTVGDFDEKIILKLKRKIEYYDK